MNFSETGGVFTLTGAIGAGDEPILARLVAAARALPGSERGIRLNLRALQNFSTSAVRIWMDAKASLLAHGGGAVAIEQCSSAFVDFANIYGEAIDGLTLLSAFVPTECVACARKGEILVDLAQGIPEFGPLLLACPSCGEATAAAVDREDYFACVLDPSAGD